MKKTKYYAWMMAAVLAMTGCSDEIDTGGENGGTTIDGETGYVKLAINLPTTSGSVTRSINDVFDDGVEGEYKVNDLIVALFYGKNEADAVCSYAFSIDDSEFIKYGTSTDNITSYYEIGTRSIIKPADGDKVYALAIVNNGGIFGVDANNMLTMNGTTYGKANTNALTSTIHEVNLSVIAKTETGEENFLMLNAPEANAPTYTDGNKPDDFGVFTLPQLVVYTDKNDADAANPDNIYVERAVAKVSVKLSGTESDGNSYEIDGPIYAGATATIQGWRLQNTNKKYYYLRNVSDWEDWVDYYVGSAANRFWGGSKAGLPYRTYWAVDPNYNTLLTSDEDLNNNFTILDENTVDWNKVSTTDADYPEYCAENTTTAPNMNDTQLTSVLVKAKFKLDNTEDTDINDNLFMINKLSAIYTESQFLTNLKNVLINEQHPLGENEKLAIKTDAKEGFITDATGLNGLIEVTGGTSSTLSPEQANAILEYAGNEIKYYKDGVMYYYASLIKHFGDDLTPYKGNVANPTYTPKEHLGRFGVVRNNWYEITITGVSGPGDPIPVIPNKPGDKQYSYINTSVNILSWAKRIQSVEL